MEAPGLDFGGSGDDFSKLSLVFLVCCLEDVPPVLPPEVPPTISPMLVEPMRLKKLPPAGLKTWDMPEMSACAKGVVG